MAAGPPSQLATEALAPRSPHPDQPEAPSTGSTAPGQTTIAGPQTAAQRSGAEADGYSPASIAWRLFTVLGNVTILTGLLIYFGWRRSQTHAERLGFDQSILGMSTQDYVLRSVGPVLGLLVLVAGGGLVLVWLERGFAHRMRLPDGADSPIGRHGLRLGRFAWLVLPVTVWLIGFVFAAAAYVLLPLSIGLGVLVMLYCARVRRELAGVEDRPGQQLVTRACGAIIVCVSLFWAASNYAEVLGDALASDLINGRQRLNGLILYSRNRLQLTAPGVRECLLEGRAADLRYEYSGLRLLEHTGDRYFLVSDEWTQTYGVIMTIRESNDVRLEFIQGMRPADLGPCADTQEPPD